MGPIEFTDIRAHLARDAVIVVDASLDLLGVAAKQLEQHLGDLP